MKERKRKSPNERMRIGQSLNAANLQVKAMTERMTTVVVSTDLRGAIEIVTETTTIAVTEVKTSVVVETTTESTSGHHHRNIARKTVMISILKEKGEKTLNQI